MINCACSAVKCVGAERAAKLFDTTRIVFPAKMLLQFRQALSAVVTVGKNAGKGMPVRALNEYKSHL